MSEISDLKQSALAEYVSHRKVILDLLQKAMKLQPNDKYVKEEVIHKLIMPMRKTSDEVSCDANNLWLINERLVFHNYLASDKKFEEMPIVENGDDDRPDLIMLQAYDNPLLTSDSDKLPLATITVIELKRPMRNDMSEDDNPIVQSLRYLEKLRKGNCKTKDGRPIPESENIPGFCYIIADITDTLKEQCNLYQLTATADKMGFFGYMKNYNTYMEVIYFDQLYNGAVERNKAFFDKLGLPNC